MKQQRESAEEIPVPILMPARESFFSDFMKQNRVSGRMKIGVISPMIIYCINSEVLSI